MGSGDAISFKIDNTVQNNLKKAVTPKKCMNKEIGGKKTHLLGVFKCANCSHSWKCNYYGNSQKCNKCKTDVLPVSLVSNLMLELELLPNFYFSFLYPSNYYRPKSAMEEIIIVKVINGRWFKFVWWIFLFIERGHNCALNILFSNHFIVQFIFINFLRISNRILSLIIIGAAWVCLLIDPLNYLNKQLIIK